MNRSSFDTKEERKHQKYWSKIPVKYITRWLGYEKNPHKDIFQMTNHLGEILLSPNTNTLLNPLKRHHRHK